MAALSHALLPLRCNTSQAQGPSLRVVSFDVVFVRCGNSRSQEWSLRPVRAERVPRRKKSSFGVETSGLVACMCSYGEAVVVGNEESKGLVEVEVASGDGNGNGKAGGGGGGGGQGGGGSGGGGEGGEDGEKKEFGVLLNAEEVARELEKAGVVLPADMAEAANRLGIRKLLLSRYIELQVGFTLMECFSCSY
jgi:hypothetical protein